MEPDGTDSPPFWPPPTSTTVNQRLRRRISPPSFLSPVALILLLPIVLLLIIFFVIFPFLSHTSQFLRPANLSVKISWDSVNVLLVVFAILCGVFARRKEEVPVPAAGDQNVRSLNSSETVRSSHYGYNSPSFEPEMETVRSSDWYNTTPIRPETPETEPVHSNGYWYNTTRFGPENRLRRSISSTYPDVRQGSFWDGGENRFQFYDDFQVNFYNRSPAEMPPESDNFDGEQWGNKEEGEDADVKVIAVDTFKVTSSLQISPPASPQKSTPPPLSPPEPPVDLKQQRSFNNVPRKVKIEIPEVFYEEAADDELKENPSPINDPQPPQPEPMVNLKQRRLLQSVPRKEKVEKPRVVADQLKENPSPIKDPQPPPAPPPPPPPLPQFSPEVQRFSEQSEQTHQKPQKKKSGTAKELTNAISSLYNQQKRKRKSRNRIVEESSSESSPPSIYSTVTVPPQAPPPPPPPPPPPSNVFHNLFKKSSKSKRQEHSETSTTTPLPPPPPSPNSIFNNIFKTGSRSKRFIPTSSSGLPPPPPPPPPPASSILNTLFKQGSKSSRFKSESSITRPPPPPPPPPEQHQSSKRKSKNSQNMIPRTTTPGKPPLPAKPSMYYEEYLNSGSQSPLVTNPSPPPLPPFQMPEFEYVASGDFVRIRSESNSRCSSPGLDDVVDDVSVKSSEPPIDGSDSIGPSVFCPSPDVNAKADNFIARLKDEWRLEKMNSVRKKQLGLGPIPNVNS